MSAPTIDEIDARRRACALGGAWLRVSAGRCQLRRRARALRWRFSPGTQARVGIVGWSLRDLASTELDGLPTTVRSEAPAAGRPGPAQRCGRDRSRRRGLTGSRSQRRGACRPPASTCAACASSRRPRARRARRSSASGGEILELVQEPEEVIARAGGAGAGRRASGASRWSWRTSSALREASRRTLGEVRPAVQPGRRIATVRRSAGLAVPLALMSADERARHRRVRESPSARGGAMSQERWSGVDDYVEEHLIGEDAALEAALRRARRPACRRSR